MKNLKSIKVFMIDTAVYLIEDENGQKGRLKIDYKKNRFQYFDSSKYIGKKNDIKIKGTSSYAKIEAETIAKDLLSRKHGVNFAGR